jgi:tellurium resistance protein TerD
MDRIESSCKHFEQKFFNKENKMSEEIKCPQCGSTQIAAGKKGFGLGKAIGGGLLLGPVGLLGGAIGKNKIVITCLKCGKQWRPGK